MEKPAEKKTFAEQYNKPIYFAFFHHLLTISRKTNNFNNIQLRRDIDKELVRSLLETYKIEKSKNNYQIVTVYLTSN